MIKNGRSVINRKPIVSGLAFPSGVVMPLGSTLVPSGFLVCDGSSLLISAYPDLFKVIGNKFGSADSLHFNLPDLRGRFLRGVAGSSTDDPDKLTRTAQCPGGNTGNAIGSVQDSKLKGHCHTINHSHNSNTLAGGSHNHFSVADVCATGAGTCILNSTNHIMACYIDTLSTDGYELDSKCGTLDSTPTGDDTHSHTVVVPNYSGSTGSFGNGESRPINIYLNFIIKI